MNLLAIDPGSLCGWASSINGIIESGVQSFNLKRGESRGMRYVRFRAWLKEMIDFIKPHIIVYELAHHRGGFATEVLVGMTTRIMEICEEENIEYNAVHSATLKKFATEKGNASKEMMLKLAREKWGNGIIDDNEADALFLLSYAEKEFGYVNSITKRD